jgi:hypothetical protein
LEAEFVRRFEELGDAAREDFAADVAGGRIVRRHTRKMLAAPIADLDLEASGIRE